MSRERIHDAIWGDVVVGDNSLTNAIIIRKAFGDNARNPSVIETIPKRGYRLIAEVTTLKPPVAKRSFGWV
ncbi:transcriptional regulator [Shimia abyssi]|uniref:Transcriptional regulator n=1 Tax=Shimia abyssi TaxID=1662395 RepID=A0A2P8F8Y6_9RHOB|nr:transcriptional regulator [Shimia abyssi]